MSRAIGIDLGTSACCVGIWKQDRAEIVTNEWGNTKTPSYVSFTDKGRLIGDAAKYRASINPYDTVFNFKRLLGRKFSSPDVQDHINKFPFEVVERNDIPFVRVSHCGSTKDFTAQEITSMVFFRLKELAEFELGSSVSQAVITVPSYFSFPQRAAIMDAAKIAGLRTLRILSPATAAAIAYHHTMGPTFESRNVLILDFGAEGLDSCLFTCEEEVMDVKATMGDPGLGGLEIDECLVTHFALEFKRRHDKDVYSYPRALQKLRVACERVKRNLSSNLQVPLEVDSLVEGVGLYTIITRTQFENLCESVLNRTLNTLRQILEVTSIERSAIDEIVMVGGASQIPYISTLVKDFFGGKTLKYLDPDSATVSGATTFAAILSPPAIDLPLLLLDATSLALGVETAGGAMTVVVRQHATLPTKKTGSFTTVSDNQPGVSIRIYEGNCARTKDNEFLGRLELWGIPPAPRGIPQIDITFDLNNKGLDMTIRAELRGTGESTSLTLNRGRLARDVVNRMEWELRRSRADEQKAAARRLAAQPDPDSHAYYLLSLMTEDGLDFRGAQASPPHHDDGEPFFESSQREFDRRDKGLDIVLSEL